MSRFGGYQDNEPLTEFYDVSYANRKDIDFFVGYSGKVKGKTLELGCGTGRILIPTAIAGCEITGLDISPSMLKKCQEKIDQQSKQVRELIRVVQGNMVDFNIDESFSLVTVPFRPFQHLISTEEQRSCLHCVHKHLDSGGLLILDLFHPFLPALYEAKYQVEIEDFAERGLPDGRRIRRTHRNLAIHRDKQYLECEMVYHISYPDGRKERHVQSFPFRYFFRYEVEHLLELSGFKTLKLFGDFDGSRFSSESAEMIFVAEKKQKLARLTSDKTQCPSPHSPI